MPDPAQFGIEAVCGATIPLDESAAEVEIPPREPGGSTTMEKVIVAEEEDRRRLALGLGGLHLSYPQVVSASVAVMLSSQPKTYDCRTPCDFRGPFVELEPGLSGLIPISELGVERDTDPRTVFPPGEKIKVKVMTLDPNRQRISLSVKAYKHDQERREYASHMDKGSSEPTMTGFGAQLQAALKPIKEKTKPAKKVPAKKTPAKKTTAKKTPVKKAPAKKAPAKKAPAKKTPAKKTTTAKTKTTKATTTKAKTTKAKTTKAKTTKAKK